MACVRDAGDATACTGRAAIHRVGDHARRAVFATAAVGVRSAIAARQTLVHHERSVHAAGAFLMLEAVVRGGFVAFVPNSVARQAVKLGRVRVLASFQPSAGVHALYHQTDSAELARKAVGKLIENARQLFEND
jgi:DNA-binding transcriptional LysR family regulator